MTEPHALDIHAVMADFRMFGAILERLGYARRIVAKMSYAARQSDALYWTEVLEQLRATLTS